MLVHEINSSTRYTILGLYNVENVCISNGIVVGDKDKHDYNSVESTHEWGYGVEIKGSTNIKLYNLQIQEMTGDGIMIAYHLDKNKTITSENIEIFNNSIFNCRRQGISVACAKNIDIHDNEIYNIEGTEPAATIDLEPDNETQLVENVRIYNNKLINKNNRKAIQILKYVRNTEIFDNQINGHLSIRTEQDEIKIKGNTISNGAISFRISKDEISDIWKINKAQLIDNKIENCTIKTINVKDILISNNEIINTKIEMQSSNVAIVDNIFDNYNTEEKIYKYEVENGDTNSYNLYLWNNNISENQEEIVESEYLTVNKDYESLQEYIKNVFNS